MSVIEPIERSEVAGDVSRAERDGMKRETSDYESLHRLEMRTGERGRR
jgi:hypothetical protein